MPTSWTSKDDDADANADADDDDDGRDASTAMYVSIHGYTQRFPVRSRERDPCDSKLNKGSLHYAASRALFLKL